MFDADGLAGKDLTEIDLLAVEADAAISRTNMEQRPRLGMQLEAASSPGVREGFVVVPNMERVDGFFAFVTDVRMRASTKNDSAERG